VQSDQASFWFRVSVPLGVPIIKGVISWYIELLHIKQSTQMHKHTNWEAKKTAFKVLKFIIIPWSSTPKFASTTNSYLLRHVVQQILHHLQHRNVLYTKPPLPKFAPMRNSQTQLICQHIDQTCRRRKSPFPAVALPLIIIFISSSLVCLLEQLSKPSHTTKNASIENTSTSKCHRK